MAGSRSIGKVAEKMGMEVFSTDIIAYPGIDHVGDILELDASILPWAPDIVAAGPPCTGFSVASISHHWAGGKGAYIPKSDTARLGIKLVQKVISLIEELSPAVWYIENPRGVMRKMPFMEKLATENFRHTITYCQYGDRRMKPTDIWTNNDMWEPRPKCKNGDPCHEAAPRGSKTGTQGLKGAYERSMYPEALCWELLFSAANKINNEDNT